MWSATCQMDGAKLIMLYAFHNKQSLKEKYVKRVEAHYKADEIVQGIYWENGKGCAVGCTMEMDNDSVNIHRQMEKVLGIPEWLALLEDGIFEGLPNEEAKKFPLRFLQAIKPGADLSKVEYQFKIWLLVDKHNGVIQWANDETKKIIKDIVKLQKRALKGDMPSESDWSSVARSAARSAAWSAARSAAWSAAWSAHYEKMADKLISLLKKAK